MLNDHGVTLLEQDMHEIELIVNREQSKELEELRKLVSDLKEAGILIEVCSGCNKPDCGSCPCGTCLVINELSAYRVSIGSRHSVIVAALNLADAVDRLEKAGIKEYKFINQISMNLIF